MGYWVLIFSDHGEAIFQATKNYPDLTFAETTPFYALVTTSLKQGFVPGMLRADDASVAMAVRGAAGSRIVLVMVTSELATGQTMDLEERLQWRLAAVYRAAVCAVGSDRLQRQPMEPLKRLLAQRLSPIVSRIMSEEPALTLSRVPRLGMTLYGAAVEWLPRGPAAQEALTQLREVLAPDKPQSIIMALSWQGRLLAATDRWLSVNPVDQGLLLALAEHTGPASFDQPSRSWALEEVDHLWLPSALAATGHDAEATNIGPSDRSNEVTSPSKRNVSAIVEERIAQYRLVNIRLYSGGSCQAPSQICCAASEFDIGKQDVVDRSPAFDEKPLPPALSLRPSSAEADAIFEDESSLVLSLLEEEDTHSGRTAEELQIHADMCKVLLQKIWPEVAATRGTAVPRVEHGELDAAMILDELTQEVMVFPSSWHGCALPHWQCHLRRQMSCAVRRLMYWAHALPPLTSKRTQHYVHSEGYAIGAVRRKDGVQFWGLLAIQHNMESQRRVDQGFETKYQFADSGIGSAVPASVAPPGGSSLSSALAAPEGRAAEEMRVIDLVEELSERLPEPLNFHSVTWYGD